MNSKPASSAVMDHFFQIGAQAARTVGGGEIGDLQADLHCAYLRSRTLGLWALVFHEVLAVLVEGL